MQNLSKIILAVLGSGIIYLGFSLVFFNSEEEWFRDFENFSDMNSRELMSLPKYDRPDLADLHDFHMTKDLSLGFPPTERLIEGYNYTKSLMSRRRAIEGVEWTERGPNNFGGRTRALMFDPNDSEAKKVWAAGVSGGLWVNVDITDPLSSWEKTNDFFTNIAVNCITYDPNDSQTFYFGTGEGWGNGGAVRGNGIWKSEDGGSSWNQLTSTTTSDFHYIQKIVITENSSILAATRASSGIQRSTDGGASWTGVLDEARGADIEKVGSILYASTGISGNGKLWKSTDDGISWSEITPDTGGERIEIGVHGNHEQTVYAIAARGGSVEWFFRSDDGGANWIGLDVPKYVEQSCDPSSSSDFTRGQAWYDLIIGVHPSDPKTVIIGGIDLYRSKNGGSSWDLISYWTGACDTYVHADQHNIQFRPGHNDHAIVSNDGGVYFTTNVTQSTEKNGPDFDPRNKDFNVAQFYACAARNEVGSDWFLAGAQDNGSHLFTEIGVNSTREVTGGDGAFCFIDQNEGDIQITSYVYNSYYITTDSWASVTNVEANGGRFINPADYNSNTNTLYAAGNANKLVRYAVDDELESEELTVSLGGQAISAVTVSPYSDDILFAGTGNGKLYQISGANASPSATKIDNEALGGYISCVAVGESDSHLMVVISNYGQQSLYETKDGGETWTTKEGNLPDMPVRWALYNPSNYDEVLIATELGVWSTDNVSAENPEWEPSNEGLANVRCDMLKYRDSDGLVILATHGRGLYTSDIFVQNPIPKFRVTSDIGYVGKPIDFINASLKATTYNWNFGDGTSSTDVTPSHSYESSGTFTVSLEIDGDPELTTSNDVVIQAKASVDYALTDGGDFETNTNHFTAVTLAGTGFELGSSNVPGKSGTVSGSNAWVTGLNDETYVAYSEAYLYSPLFDFSLSGTYSLEFYTQYAIEDEWEGFVLEYSTDYGSNWSKVGDYIDVVNWYNLVAISSAVVWEPGETFFSGDTDGQYEKKIVDVSHLSNNSNVAFRFVFKTDPASEEAGIAIDDFKITGPSDTTPNLEFAIQGSQTCAGEEMVFVNSSTGDIQSFNWDFGTGATPAQATGYGPHAVIYATSGDKTITLTGLTSSGDITEEVNISIGSLPIDVVPSYNEVVCNGDSVIISISGAEEDVSYKVYNTLTEKEIVAPVTSNTTAIEFNLGVLSSGAYHLIIRAESASGCTLDLSEEILIEVRENKNIKISERNSGNLQVTLGDEYQWYLDDELLDGETAREITPINDGTYTCEVIIDGCLYRSEEFIVLTVLGDNGDDRLILYPNPVRDILRIEGVKSKSRISIYNLSGKLVHTASSRDENTVFIDISGFKKGIYSIMISNEGTRVTHKIVKE